MLGSLVQLNQVNQVSVLMFGQYAIGLVDNNFADTLPRALFARQEDRLVVRAEVFPQTEIEAWFKDHTELRKDWRGEAFAIHPLLNHDIELGQLDRGILAHLGMSGQGIHVNGYVEQDGELLMWVAQRAKHKHTSPNKWDQIVAGGVTFPLSPFETMQKESEEEANIDASLSGQATLAGELNYVYRKAQKIRPDKLYCYDLLLPRDFEPTNNDGEVQQFALQPFQQVLDDIINTDKFKLNSSAVIIDFAIRHGVIDVHHAKLNALRGKLTEGKQVIAKLIRGEL